MDDEWLFFSVSTHNPWRALELNPQRCAKDLKPRRNERKSAWAHVPNNFKYHPHRFLHPVAVAAGCLSFPSGLANCVLRQFPIVASRKLQALCMLLHTANAQPHTPAEKVVGLSIRRAAIKNTTVNEFPEQHVVPAYDVTHRELGFETAADQERQELIKELQERRHLKFELVDYTLDELRPLISMLLRAKLLRAPFDEVAKGMLKETSNEE